ncbi:hypothetical protein TSAR_005815 [Trichomalopsis sarcophagae]|uniref:DJ-1/PfpI domain-containing protein n=1 Tax=Trichomalopsis sarcophagae TaxID=543379 RepID=A0A232FMA7_9HYME|nr:hypothetical protein TSAR_005815 [Trichomalopsis sarcophagae]
MLQCIKSVKLLKDIPKLGLLSSTNLLHTSQICHKKRSCCGPPKVAVVLCGCGALDGTEISEAVSVAIHLSSKNIEPHFYAPDVNICGTVNHLTKDPDNCDPPRNALVEGARLARAAIKPLCECRACDNAGLVIPGGWGAARTLSDFASKGCDCVVLPELERVIKEFNCASRPIGSICIASAILAKVLNGAKVTLGKDLYSRDFPPLYIPVVQNNDPSLPSIYVRTGPKEQWVYSDAIEKVKQMGAKVELKDVKGVTHCKQYNAYSTPAWMDTQASYADIHEGIGKMIAQMRKCIK